MKHLARGEFVVKLQASPADAQAAGTLPAAIVGMSFDKMLSGDLVGTTRGQMLSAMGTVQGSAGYAAMEAVQGRLQGRQGSFVLQHSGAMNRGVPGMAVSVVPGSGTGELTGLPGDFHIIVADGPHRFEFNYTLAGAAA